MPNDKVPPPFDHRVAHEVEEAARAAHPGGMDPNTDFRMVPEKDGNYPYRPENMKQDDSYSIIVDWHCTNSFKVRGKEYFYQYRPDFPGFGALCLIYDPKASSS